MPQSPSYRRDLESQKLLLEQELYRLFGSDYSDLKWVRKTLTRLESRRVDIGHSDQDHADLNKVRDILDRANAIAAFYNPNQPRDALGRWSQSLNVKKAVARLETHAKREPPKPKEGECAKYVREAIAAGGIVFDPNDQRKSARDYGVTLQKYGFDAEAEASAQQGYPPNRTYRPQAGDVVVIQPTRSSKDGHMAMFSGRQWISDFKQRGENGGFWPGKTYAEQKPSYVIYRYPKVH
jgi:hypothetical protein